MSLQKTAEQILGPVDWQTPERGFCTCPGQADHTTPSGPRDCRIHIDGAPTLHCVHGSCADAIATANRALRSAIAKVEYTGGTTPITPRPRQADPVHQREKRLAARAQAGRDAILADPRFQLNLADLWEESPTRLLGDAESDWRLFLNLFSPSDLIWIGDKRESGPGHEHHFRTRDEWLQQPAAPGPLMAPCAFKPGTASRSKQNIARQDYLVIESDTLSESEQLAVIGWIRQFMALRAVVFSGRRSLHSWWQWPAQAVLEQLRSILPSLGVDPASLRLGHCSRAPSYVRSETGNLQSLLYLSL